MVGVTSLCLLIKLLISAAKVQGLLKYPSLGLDPHLSGPKFECPIPSAHQFRL